MARTRPKKPGKPFKRKLHINGEVWTYQANHSGVRVRSPDGLDTYFIDHRDNFYFGNRPSNLSWANSIMGATPSMIRAYIEQVILGGQEWDLRAEINRRGNRSVPEALQKRGVDTWPAYERFRTTLPIRRLISRLTEPGETFTVQQLTEAFQAEPHVYGRGTYRFGGWTPGRGATNEWFVERAVLDVMATLTAFEWVKSLSGKVGPEEEYVLVPNLREKNHTSKMALLPRDAPCFKTRDSREDVYFDGPGALMEGSYDNWGDYQGALKIPAGKRMVWPFPYEVGDFLEVCRDLYGVEPVLFDTVLFPDVPDFWRPLCSTTNST